MHAISQHDYRTMLDCIARLYECENPEEFPHVALEEIPRLVGNDHITFNYVAPAIPKVVVLGRPDLTGSLHAERERVFARYLSDQPILRHYLATGDPGPHMFSDFLSVRDYHRLPLYRHLYHELRYEDQLAFMLFPPGSEMIAIALARDRRNFTERDRQLLNLLRPHVAIAYRHQEKLALLRRALFHREVELHDARVTTIVLDARDRPIQFGPQARQWIDHYFPPPHTGSGQLPETVTGWLSRRHKTDRAPMSASRHGHALVRERNGQRLRLNLFPALSGEHRTLVLELETVAGAAQSVMADKLTRREIEVLLQVEQGKTNEETAAALGISPLTVRTHLEHIFEKLHVPSRTAAVTQFRRACSSSA